ncbi:MAG: TorF family putative porin [Gammaproteobacteria bacterium]|nr:TorF family putative porin [Gammaproteobacteria bacterium]
MKKLSQAIVCASALTMTGFSSLALAEAPLTANVGVTSNYIWRGATQGADDSAISGGIDYAHSSGFYAGTWVSSLGGDSQYEHDVYLGYGGKAGPISYDVSYIKYIYPVGTAVENDFSELNVSVGYGPVTFLYAPTLSNEAGAGEDDTYISVSAEFEVKKDLTLGLVYGSYDMEEAGSDYTHFQVSLSKGDFVFALDKMDPETDDPTGVSDAARFSVSWSKSFDL